MRALPGVVKEAWNLYWQHAVHMTFFNCIWLVLQLPIVTAPAATAAMYAVTHRLSEGEFVAVKDVWTTVREMFIPAWKWASVNLLVVIVAGGNLWLARTQVGDLWVGLRLVWTLALLVWFAANLLYWPLWLAETDRSVRNTLRNCFVLLLRAPGLVFSVALFSAALFVLSLVTIIPLVNGVMVWIAATGLLTGKAIVRQITE